MLTLWSTSIFWAARSTTPMDWRSEIASFWIRQKVLQSSFSMAPCCARSAASCMCPAMVLSRVLITFFPRLSAKRLCAWTTVIGSMLYSWAMTAVA